VKGATSYAFVPNAVLSLSFNPRTREGCDTWTHSIQQVNRAVSIHAPVKGATLRLVREATRRIKCFNPRTREGCDVSRCTTPPTMPRFQSTHP